MKQYPSITKIINYDTSLIVQNKYDGSNIRAEFNSKKGFYKFGSRTQLIDSSNKPLGKAISLIKDKYEIDLTNIFKEQSWQNVICFFEFFGQNSFAGQHLDTEEQTVVLLDVNVYKQGMMEPNQFIKLFGHLDTPKILFEGKINSAIIDSVKNSTLQGMSFEGVVCKGPNDKKTKAPIMFKVKSQAWLDKLKDHCKGDDNLFSQLQ